MRNILVFILILLTKNLTTAQHPDIYGISYAPTFAKINEKGHRQLGHQAGVQAQWLIGNRFSWRLGLEYSFIRTESHLILPPMGEDIAFRYRHYDILLPVQAQYGLSPKRNRLFLSLGLMPTINVGRRVTEQRSNETYEQDITRDRGYKSLDLYMTGGLGYEVKFKNDSRLFVQYLYRDNFPSQFLSLIKYLAQGADYSDAQPPVRMKGFEFGYMFKL